MPSQSSQTPIPPGHAVRVLFCIRANKGLYGYAYGPFRYDEERRCYVFENRTYSVEQWEAEGAELILKWYKYRPSVRVEIVKDETPAPVDTPAAPVAAVDAEAVAEPAAEATPAAEVSAPAPSLPVPGDVTAPEPVAEPAAVPAPAPEPAAVVEEPAAPAPTLKRTRRPRAE